MAKPCILAVDDDPQVLRAIERDLRARYAEAYQVVAAGTGGEGLEVVQELTRRGDPVALFLVDQRMPGLSGTDFLREALRVQPGARRILLTAYADTGVAIAGINELRLDHYILKPWDPAEERLYPVLDDVLGDWGATFRPRHEGLRLLAQRWSPRGHLVRDFLTRQQIPYTWPDPESEEARGLLAALPPASDPAQAVVLLPDGRALYDPSPLQLAEAVGLATHAARPFYDLVIVGAGPAGLAAAVYGASEGLKTLLVEREAPGGQAGTTSRIENYLGFPAGLSGADLARRALSQAQRLGAEILSAQDVQALRRDDPYRTVLLADGSELACQACIVATGVSYRQLEVPGARELAGAGLYYGAATSEAMLYRDCEVGVLGAGNSAGQAAVYLARYARRVLLYARRASLAESMSAYLIEQIAALPNVEVHVGSEVTALAGTDHLEAATVRTAEGEAAQPLAALFVYIGQQPRTEWLADLLARDDDGYVLTGADLTRSGRRLAWMEERDPYLLETCVPGVFAAGDVRRGSVKRLASAVGEGAMAVQFAHQYLASM